MRPSATRILTLNSGSSSIKFGVYEGEAQDAPLLRGRIERIGSPMAKLSVPASEFGASMNTPVPGGSAAAAVAVLADWIGQHAAAMGLRAIGHRVVHGGPHFAGPAEINDAVMARLRELDVLDPEHMPGARMLIEACRERLPDLPQFACFDTAFHHEMPPVARQLPIPRRYTAGGLRRFGFHGLSYEYLMGELERLDGIDAAKGRVVLAHLGNGASLAAVKGGKPVDTTMGLTPASGLVMGSRSGDVDPGLVAYLARVENMTPARFDQIANRESGLLGVSETSADMRDLLERESSDPRAADAIALFCYQARKGIGAFAAALGGLDTLVFSGGIGENAAVVRERICADLGFLGVVLDPLRNAAHADRISTIAGRVKVRVIRTDEERVIARTVARRLPARPVPQAAMTLLMMP